MIRPQPASWFELLAARPDVLTVLETLSRTGCVEFELAADDREPPEIADMARVLGEYRTLSRKYRPYLPVARLLAPSREMPPAAALSGAFARLRTWVDEVDPLIARLQQSESQLRLNEVWERVLGDLREEGIPLDVLARAGPHLEAALFVLPQGAELSVPEGMIEKRWTSGADDFLLCAGTPFAVRDIADGVGAVQGRKVSIPDWLLPLRDASLDAIRQRIEALRKELDALRSSIDASSARNALAEALGEIARSAWYLGCMGALEGDGVVCRVRGWTDAPAKLEAALDALGARALLHFPPAAEGARPPMVLRNPFWAKPFELFTRLLGMPSGNSADPSTLLALIVPLIFGYMFGDVGQGLLLVCAGASLGRRWQATRLLIAGGLSAILFGLLFGSVFSLEGLMAPLWLHPLEDPLRVLMVPLYGGFILLVLGIMIGALEANWSGTLQQWWLHEAGPLVAYIGAVAAFFQAWALFLVTLGATVSVLGPAIDQRRIGAAAAGAGEFVEKTLQLLINTISFVRVGAFALAHAGLSSAVTSMTTAADSPVAQAAILVLGNFLIVVLEVMAVSIQTTRLVLFEFFVRFFNKQGREFRPIAPPSMDFEESQSESKS